LIIYFNLSINEDFILIYNFVKLDDFILIFNIDFTIIDDLIKVNIKLVYYYKDFVIDFKA
jgi:hypothetical protein